MDIPAKAAGLPTDDQPFYKPRQRIYPQSVHGTYRRIKWIVLLVTLGIYCLTPFIRWDRGPGAPDQAVLTTAQPALLFLLLDSAAGGSTHRALSPCALVLLGMPLLRPSLVRLVSRRRCGPLPPSRGRPRRPTQRM